MKVPLTALGIVLVAAAWAPAADPEASYTFSLTVDPSTGTVTGEGQIALVNSSDRPLERIPLILYPNRFETKDRRITDVNFSRFYSYRFHEGDMKLERIVGPGGVPCDLEVLEGMPEHTYVAIKLPAAVAPKQTATIGIRFITHVPDRFGLFGRRGDRVMAEGGLWPMIAARDRQGAFAPGLGPIRARHDVTVKATSGTAFVAPAREARNLFVGAGEDMEPVFRLDAHPALLAPEVIVHAAKDDDRLQRIALLVQGAAQVFARDWLPGEPLEPIHVVIGPVRDRIAHAAGDVVVISDRAFEVLPYLDSFHEREITRAAFELLARRALLGQEEADAAWVSEVTGWVAINEWDRKRLGLKGSDVREGLGTFDFIQLIDTQLRAPQFTDSDLYFGQVFEPRDAARDELDRFGSARPRGRVVAEKLRDKVGAKKLLEIVLARGTPFRERASLLAKEDLTGFFDLWLGAPPREFLSIEAREPATLPGGQEGLAVTIRRTSDDPRLYKVGDPVVLEAHSGGETDRTSWDGKGETGTVYVPRRGLYYSLELDPEGRIEELYRGDDLFPSIAKVLLNRFNFSLDLNGGNTSSVDLGLTIHPHHDYQQSILVDAFYTLTAQGGRIGYAYHFGSPMTNVQFAQTAYVAGTFEHLDPGLFRLAADTVSESEGVLCAYTIGYSLSTREAAIRQTHGFTFGAALDSAYGPVLGGDFTYERLSASVSYLFTPIEPVTFAFEASGGQVEGTDPPSQALFDVGGEGAVRGVRTGDFVDRSLFVARGEMRVSLLEDLDIGCLKIFWIRRVELAGFTEAGDVKQRFGNIFRAPSEWKWGSGAGIRVEIDALGIRPVLVRFDIAWRCDSGTGPDRGRPQYYLGINEPF